MARSGAPVAGGTLSTSPFRRGRGLAIGGVAIVATLLAMAAMSFACSPAVGSSSITPDAGGPGSEVLVRGWGYAGPVEIRWGSSTGPLLAVATPSNSTISQKVTIPASDPGFYSVVVTSVDPVTSQPIKSSSTFKVTSSATAPDPTVTEPAPSADPAPAPSTASPAAGTSAQAATQSSAPAVAAAATNSSSVAPASSAAQAPAATAGSAPAAASASRQPSATQAPGAATQAPVAATQAPGAATQAPVAATQAPSPSAAAGPTGAPATAPTAAAPADSPARVEALPQPWSSSPAQSHGLFDAATPDSRPFGAGIVFVALGFAASLAFAAVVGRRRLVQARSHAES